MTSENGSNAFAFEPEYPVNEVEERLQADREEGSSDEDDVSIGGWMMAGAHANNVCTWKMRRKEFAVSHSLV